MSIFKNSPPIVTNGLVLNLDAANTKSYPKNGIVWSDLSGNNNTGSLVNGPTFSSDSGGGIVFNGVNNYVGVGNTNTINPASAITVSSFFNIASVGANFAPIMFKQNNYNTSFEQYLLLLTNTSIVFSITGVDRVQKSVTSPIDYRNRNVYAVGTCDTVADEIKLYINGVLIQTLSFTSTFDIANTILEIGGTGILYFGNTFPGWANGKIYTAQVYNRALSASEVFQNYNAQKSRYNLK